MPCLLDIEDNVTLHGLLGLVAAALQVLVQLCLGHARHLRKALGHVIKVGVQDSIPMTWYMLGHMNLPMDHLVSCARMVPFCQMESGF